MAEMGRPTKYKPEMCDVVIRLGKQGASKAEMALELDIHMSTFDDWQNNNPDFSKAVKKAIEFSKGWWEKLGRDGASGINPNTNSTMYIFNMKNRFKEDWSDMSRKEITGADGKDLPAIQVQFVGDDDK